MDSYLNLNHSLLLGRKIATKQPAIIDGKGSFHSLVSSVDVRQMVLLIVFEED